MSDEHRVTDLGGLMLNVEEYHRFEKNEEGIVESFLGGAKTAHRLVEELLQRDTGVYLYMEAGMTAEEFEAAYAKRSGMTVAQLRVFRLVRPCACGEDICEGWQSVSFETAAEIDAGLPGPRGAQGTNCGDEKSWTR